MQSKHRSRRKGWRDRAYPRLGVTGGCSDRPGWCRARPRRRRRSRRRRDRRRCAQPWPGGTQVNVSAGTAPRADERAQLRVADRRQAHRRRLPRTAPLAEDEAARRRRRRCPLGDEVAVARGRLRLEQVDARARRRRVRRRQRRSADRRSARMFVSNANMNVDERVAQREAAVDPARPAGVRRVPIGLRLQERNAVRVRRPTVPPASVTGTVVCTNTCAGEEVLELAECAVVLEAEAAHRRRPARCCGRAGPMRARLQSRRATSRTCRSSGTCCAGAGP